MKERKILTKIGIIFGVIALILILIGVLFFKPKTILADTTPQDDYLMMNELYMFDYLSFNNNPNFESGYISKKTITPSDIYTGEISTYYGWYKDLGADLMNDYFSEDDNDRNVFFGVQLNGVLANYFQIAYAVSSPMQTYFRFKFTDGTLLELDAETMGFGEQIITFSPTELNKNIDWFCWSASGYDYIPSFKFLGVGESYELGYSLGYNDGKDAGEITGYNRGYRRGYDDAVESGEVVYTRLQVFNQLVRNGNFTSASGWDRVTITEPNTALLNSQSAYLGVQRTYNDVEIKLSHKYYCHITYKGDDETTRNNWYFTLGNINNADFVSYQLPNNTMEYQTARFILQFKSSIVGNLDGIKNIHLYNVTNNAGNLYFKNIYLIDLTEMFGAGVEPNAVECAQIFPNDYYEYNAGTPIDIGYYTGYYDGEQAGLEEGINIGETNQINMGWIQEIFRAIQTVFNIQVFPRVTLGIIVGIPFVISLAWFVIKMFRGGGGGED